MRVLPEDRPARAFRRRVPGAGSDHLRGHRADLHLRQVRCQLRGVPRPGAPEGSTDEVGRRQTSALPCPAGRCGPWSRRSGAPQVSATRRDRSLRGAVVLVRAGSARHREPPVLAGHERSRPVWTTTARSALAARSTADEVLRLPATGKSNAELATHLYLGEGIIKTHVSHLLAKLGLRDRSKRSRSPTRAVSSNPANPDSRAILVQLLVSQRPRPAWHHVAGQRRRRAHYET